MADSPLHVRALVTDAEIAAAHAVMAELRPHLPAGEPFVTMVRRQQAEGYVLYGGFAGDRLVALAGVRATCNLSRGPHLFVDDLITTADTRGQGHGKAMLRAMADLAGSLGLPFVSLVSRDTARIFYEQVGFTIQTGLPCTIATADLAKG